MNESAYRSNLVKDIEQMFPGCVVIYNDPRYRQGIPDLLVLFRGTWFMLEVKISKNARAQPNQAYYVERFNEMSYAAFIYPENEKQVLDELQQSFSDRR
jgi:hypothetical protein